MVEVQHTIRSTCPYCGVGCQLEMNIKENHITRVDAPFDTAPNFGRLCTKGRYGLDYVHHPSRLIYPMIRKDLDKKPRKPVGLGGFRRASWEEALELAAEKIAGIVDRESGNAIGTFCSAKSTNEDRSRLADSDWFISDVQLNCGNGRSGSIYRNRVQYQ